MQELAAVLAECGVLSIIIPSPPPEIIGNAQRILFHWIVTHFLVIFTPLSNLL